MLSILPNIGLFIFLISILVIFHEFGHFIVARSLGVKVLRFSVGFGKSLLSIKSQHTEYTLGLIPLGGYIKMLDENEGPVSPRELPYAFNRKPLWVRSLVVFAGPFFNFILAILAFCIMYLIGIKTLIPIVGTIAKDSPAYHANLHVKDEIIAINGQSTPDWYKVELALHSYLNAKKPYEFTVRRNKDTLQLGVNVTPLTLTADTDLLDHIGITPYFPEIPNIIGSVLPDTPADHAQLKAEDRILVFNHQSINNWQDLMEAVNRAGGQPAQLTVQRGKQILVFHLKPDKIMNAGQRTFRLGIESKKIIEPPNIVRLQRYSLYQAFVQGIDRTWLEIKLSYKMLYRLVSGQISTQALSGPIGIAQGANMSASLGWGYFLGYLGVISISIGILNLLPIPVLDGGHLLYYLIEFLRGKPLPQTIQFLGLKIGLLFLLSIMVLAFYNDLSRILS